MSVASVGWSAWPKLPEGIEHGEFTQVRDLMVEVMPYSYFDLVAGEKCLA